METSLLFESFMVFYLLEILFLVSVAFWYYKEPKQQIKFVVNEPQKGPSASQAMAMYKMADKLRREQGLR